MVAVPVYPSVATEHWGLVTFRESRLLFDEYHDNELDKQRVVNVIAHELAHNVRLPLSPSKLPLEWAYSEGAETSSPPLNAANITSNADCL